MTRVTLSLTIGPLRLAHVVETRSVPPSATVETTGEATRPAATHRPLARCLPFRREFALVGSK
jgi:hypothetical protein